MQISRAFIVLFLFALVVRNPVGIDRDRRPSSAEETLGRQVGLVAAGPRPVLRVILPTVRVRLPADVALLVPAADRLIVVGSALWPKVQTRWRELADGGGRV